VRIQEQRQADLGQNRRQLCGRYPRQQVRRAERCEDVVKFGLDGRVERNALHPFIDREAERGKSAGGGI
jgi:hypothetical protein